MTPSGQGYFCSPWKTEQSLRFSTPTPTRSPLGRLYLKHSYASIFHQGRWLSFEIILPLSSKQRVSPFMRHGKGLKNSNRNGPIIGSRIGCWLKPSMEVYNNQWRYQLMWPPEVPSWPMPLIKLNNCLKIWRLTTNIREVRWPTKMGRKAWNRCLYHAC